MTPIIMITSHGFQTENAKQESADWRLVDVAL